MKEVTVVIPAFNAASTLRATVQSALAQTHRDVEVIVVDDGSTDGSIESLEGLDDRVVTHRFDDNSGGPARPRNTAVAMASGSHIAFLDADDTWTPRKLESQLRLLEASGGFAVASNALRFDPATGSQSTFFPAMPATASTRDLIRRNWIITSSLLVEANALRSCGPFPGEGPGIYEDWAMWLRLSTHGAIVLCDEPLVRYRDSAGDSYRSRFRHPGGTALATLADFQEWSIATGCELTPEARATLRLERMKWRIRGWLGRA